MPRSVLFCVLVLGARGCGAQREGGAQHAAPLQPLAQKQPQGYGAATWVRACVRAWNAEKRRARTVPRRKEETPDRDMFVFFVSASTAGCRTHTHTYTHTHVRPSPFFIGVALPFLPFITTASHTEAADAAAAATAAAAAAAEGGASAEAEATAPAEE